MRGHCRIGYIFALLGLLCVEALAQDHSAPAAPDGLTAAISLQGVELSWTAGSDPDLAGYIVTRAQGADVQRITSPIAVDNRFQDHSVFPGTTYRYSVQAVDADGNLSGFSLPASVHVPAGGSAIPPVTGVSTALVKDDLVLSWNVHSAARAYRIYRSVNAGPLQLVSTQDASRGFYLERNLAHGSDYHYSVRALLPDGSETPDALTASVQARPAATILLVDADPGTAEEELYREALDLHHRDRFDLWRSDALGPPSIRDLRDYSAVIWHAGSRKFPALSPEEISALEGYLARGGAVLLSSRHLLSGPYREEVDFSTGRLRIDSFATETLRIAAPFPPPVPLSYSATGIAGGPDYSGLTLPLKNRSLPVNDRQSYFLFPLAGSGGGLLEDTAGSFAGHYSASFGQPAGLRHGHIVYWAFGLEDIDLAAATPGLLSDLIDRTLAYLLALEPVLATRPAQGQTDVPINASIDLFFRSELIPSSLVGNLRLEDSSGAPVPLSYTYNAEQNSLQVAVPPLIANMSYVLHLESGVLDRFGRAVGPFALNFTSGAAIDTTTPHEPSPPAYDVAGTHDGQVVLVLPDAAVDETLNIYRRNLGDTAWDKVNAGQIAARLVVDAPLQTNSFYEYALTAQDVSGNESAVSSVLRVRSRDLVPPAVVVTTPALDPERRFRTRQTAIDIGGRSDDPTATILISDQAVHQAGLDWVAAGYSLSEEGENHLLITASDASGNTTSRDVVIVRDTSTLPPGPVSIIPNSPSVVRIEWRFSGEPDLARHLVERRDASSTPASYQEIAVVPMPAMYYEDTSAAGGPHCYRIRSADDLGNLGPYSDEVCPVGFGAGRGNIRGISRDVASGREEIATATPVGFTTTAAPENGVIYNNGGGAAFDWVHEGPWLANNAAAGRSRLVTIMNGQGFGTTGSVRFQYPAGVTIDPAQVPQFGRFYSFGTFNQTEPGYLPASPHWDATRTLDNINAEFTLASATPELVVYNFRTFRRQIGTDANGNPILSDPAVLKAISVSFSASDTTIDWQKLESPFLPIAITINGALYEANLSFFLDQDPNRRLSLMQPVDDFGGKVNLLTGDYSFGISLFSGHGLGVNVNGTLAYSSRRATFDRHALRKSNARNYTYTPLGPGWRYPYGLRIMVHKTRTWIDGQITEETPEIILLIGPGGEHYALRFSDISASPVTLDGVTFSQAYELPGPERMAEFEYPIVYAGPNGYWLVESQPRRYGFTRYEFDAEGRLIRIVPHGGLAALEISYGANEQTVVDTSGRVTRFIFNSTEKIERIEDPGGGVWSLTYAGEALVGVREQTTSYGWAFNYDADHYLLNERQLPHGFTISADYATAEPASERFYWAALRSTEWKEIPNSKRNVIYGQGSGDSPAHPDRVSISTPSRRNNHLFDINVSDLRRSSFSGQASVRLYDLDEQNPVTTRFRGLRQAKTGLHLDYMEDALGYGFESVGSEGGHTGNIWTRVNDIRYPDGTRDYLALPYVLDPGTIHAPELHIDSAGHRTHFTYYDRSTRFERLHETFPPGQTPGDPAAARISSEYDSQYRPSSLRDLNGYVTRYAYHDAPNAGQVRLEVQCVGELPTFTVTTRDPYRWTRAYDGLGRLTSETDPDGFTVTFVYDQAGRLIEQRGPAHPVSTVDVPAVEFQYDGDLVTETTWRSGPTVTKRETYLYDAKGEPVEKILPASQSDGSPIRHVLEYDDDGNLRFFKWPTSAGLAVAEYIYDNRGRVSEAIGPEGEKTQISYDEADEIVEVRQVGGTHPDRIWTILDRDGMGRAKEILLPEVTQGGITQRPKLEYVYDGKGRETEIKYSFASDRRLTRSYYDAQDQLYYQTLEMEAGQEIAVATSIQEFGRRLQPKGIQLVDNTVAGPIVRQPGRNNPTVANLERDCFGDIVRVTDLSRDERLRIAWRSDGSPRELLAPNPSQPHHSGPVPAETTRLKLSLDSLGLPASVEDVFGNRTRFTKDVYGREMKRLMADGVTLESSYDAAGDLTSVAMTDPNEAGLPHTSLNYDQAGNLIKIDGPGNRGTSRSFEYDRAGNVRKIIESNGAQTAFDYNEFGELVLKSFADGKSLEYERDNLGRVTRVIERRGTASVKTTVWEYDLLGRLSVFDDGYYRSATKFDKLGRTTEKSMTFLGVNLTETLKYTWGEYGNLVAVEDSSGYRLIYDWDDEGNLVGINVTASGIDLELDRRFDRTGRLNGWAYKSGGNAAANASVAYDQKGRLLEYAISTPNFDGIEAGYRYDGSDRIVEARYPAKRRVVRYEYDRRGYLIGENWRDDRGNPIVDEQITYDDSGNRVLRKRNNSHARYQYDSNGQLIAIKRSELTRVAAASATVDSEYSQDYRASLAIDAKNPDSDGILTGWRSAATDTEHWIELDLGATKPVAVMDVSFPSERGGVDRFHVEWRDPVRGVVERLRPTFVYHGGRRSAETITTAEHTVRLVFTPPELVQHLRVVVPRGGTAQGPLTGVREPDVVINEIGLYSLNDEDIRQTFNVAGLLVGSGPFSFGHDAEGHLTEMRGPNVDMTWRIGPDGSVVAEQDQASGETRYFFNNGANVFAEHLSVGGGTPQPSQKHFAGLGADTHLGFVSYRQTGPPTLHWVFREGPGTVVEVRSDDGLVQDQMQTNAWGELAAPSTRSTANRFGFAGLRELPGGLYHGRARIYDPKTGRFMARDPIGFASGSNPYVYAGNDPVNNIDPMGYVPWQQRVDAFAGVWYGVGRALYAVGEGAGTVVVGGAAKLLGADRRGYFGDVLRKHDQLVDGLGDLILDPTILVTGPVESFETAISEGDAFEAGTVLGETTFNAVTAVDSLAASGGYFFKGAPAGRVPRPRSRLPCVAGSFADGTAVLTSEGERPIEEVRVGDIVISRDPVTGSTAERRVAQVHSRNDQDLLRIALADSSIVVTDDHPFWVESKGWTTAIDLEPGDRIVGFGPGSTSVVGSKTRIGKGRVHNLQVEEFETYFAGDKALWVHNLTPCQLRAMRDLLRDLRRDVNHAFRQADLEQDPSTIGIARVTFRWGKGYLTEHYAAFSNMSKLAETGASSVLKRFIKPKRSSLSHMPEGRGKTYTESGKLRYQNHVEPKLLDFLIEHVNFDDIHSIALLIERGPCIQSCGPRVLRSFLNGRVRHTAKGKTIEIPIQGPHGRYASTVDLLDEIYHLSGPRGRKPRLWSPDP
jgi:RHS repeat-associated protein